MTPAELVHAGSTAFEIKGHIDAAMEHLCEAYHLLAWVQAERSDHDPGAVCRALDGLAHGEANSGQLLLLAADVRAELDRLTEYLS